MSGLLACGQAVAHNFKEGTMGKKIHHFVEFDDETMEDVRSLRFLMIAVCFGVVALCVGVVLGIVFWS